MQSLTPPIIVFGMHRSGTSVLTRILQELGVYIGQELNDKYENLLFKDINIHWLQRASAHWARPEPFLHDLATYPHRIPELADIAAQYLNDDWRDDEPVRAHRLWGWKDPRNTLTLPIWLQLFPEATLIHCVRDGVDVALSLQRRELRRLFKNSDVPTMLPPLIPRGYALWKTYVRQGFEIEQRYPRTLRIRYEDMMHDPKREIDKLLRLLAIENPPHADAIIQAILHQPTPRQPYEDMLVTVCTRLGLIHTGDVDIVSRDMCL